MRISFWTGCSGSGSTAVSARRLSRLVQAMNASHAVRVSLDLPSGAQCDDGAVLGVCVRADYTVTFSTYKPAHFLAPARDYCGEVVVAPVGIPTQMTARFRPSLSGIRRRT